MAEYGLGTRGDGRIIDAIHATQQSNWTTFTPTLAAFNAGGFTAGSGGKYLILNNKVTLINILIQLSAVTTAAGAMLINLPSSIKVSDNVTVGVGATLPNWALSGADFSNNISMCCTLQGANQIWLTYYSGASPFSVGLPVSFAITGFFGTK